FVLVTILYGCFSDKSFSSSAINIMAIYLNKCKCQPTKKHSEIEAPFCLSSILLSIVNKLLKRLIKKYLIEIIYCQLQILKKQFSQTWNFFILSEKLVRLSQN